MSTVSRSCAHYGARKVEHVGLTNKRGFRWKGTYSTDGLEWDVCPHLHPTKKEALACIAAAIDHLVRQTLASRANELVAAMNPTDPAYAEAAMYRDALKGNG